MKVRGGICFFFSSTCSCHSGLDLVLKFGIVRDEKYLVSDSAGGARRDFRDSSGSGGCGFVSDVVVEKGRAGMTVEEDGRSFRDCDADMRQNVSASNVVCVVFVFVLKSKVTSFVSSCGFDSLVLLSSAGHES